MVNGATADLRILKISAPSVRSSSNLTNAFVATEFAAQQVSSVAIKKTQSGKLVRSAKR